MAILITDVSQIKARQVRLILPSGPIIVDKAEALLKATTDGLDLVLMQESDMPVVKILDFTKLEYDKQKTQKVNKPKKAKQIQIGPHTQEHDLKRFADNACEFIAEGHPTSLRLEVRGRDRGFKDLIKQKIDAFVALVPSAKPGKLNVSEDGSMWTISLS